MRRIGILLVAVFFSFVSTAWPQALPQSRSKIITIDAPGAGTGADQGTWSESINLVGVTAGFYVDANGAIHGFVRTPDGTITTFDAPGSTATLGETINLEGAITGFYYDANNVFHGFVRAPKGKITSFDAPGAGTSAGQGTAGFAINPEMVIVGYYTDADNVNHGFVRNPLEK